MTFAEPLESIVVVGGARGRLAVGVGVVDVEIV